MAYSNGFQGSVQSLEYILQTLERKVVAIPGLTCSDGLSVSAAGEVAYFYTRGDSSVAEGTLGAKMDFTSSGLTRNDIPMTTCLQIKTVLPHANVATVDANLVNDKVVQETIEAANLYNTKFLAELEKSTGEVTGTDALTKDNVYGKIVDGITEFKTINKAKGLKPTAIVVSSKVAGLLLQSPEFAKRSTDLGDLAVAEGYIGKVAGLPVVEAPDCAATTDFILIHKEGIGAPQNVNTLYVVDGTAAGYPGSTIIAGEIGYGFKLTDKDLVLVRKNA